MKKIEKLIKRIIKGVLKRLSYRSKFFKNIYSNILYKNSYKVKKENINKQLNNYTNNLSKTEKTKIIKDMIYCNKIYKTSMSEYFMYDFMNMNHKERSTYITNGTRFLYLRYLNPYKYCQIFKQKYQSYLKYKKYYKRKMILVESKDDKKAFVDYCNKFRFVVKKPIASSLGTGVKLIDTKDMDLNKLFNETLKEGSFVLEEKIIQGKEMAKIHPESVNTIRVVPFILDDGTVIVHRPFLKTGKGDSFVDNGGAGGILAPIDAKTGKVVCDGMDELRHVYKVHPDTKIKFKGFQIPEWNKVLKLAEELAAIEPEVRYVGWDLAYTTKGWVTVEGNGKTMFVGQQMPIRTGLKAEFEEMLNWKDVPNKKQYSKKPGKE